MKRNFRSGCCLVVVLMALIPVLNAQFDKLIQIKDKARKKVEEANDLQLGKKTMSEWLEKSPVSTSFDDATNEIDLLSEFEPIEKEYDQLAAQPRDPSGGFVLYPGAYTMTARSFCLRAGTHGPSQGDGHLYAPLRGKRADFVQQILLRYGQNPEVPQQKVQVLLWAVIAGADMNTLAEQHRQTLRQLFTVGDLAKFKAQHWLGNVADDQIDNATGSLRSMIEADTKLRDLVQKADTKYEDFERIAMLAGPAPPEDMIRQVSKGRWSYHTDGYFVRYFPNGYSQTRVDVMVPPDVRADFDQWGRVMAFNDPSIGRIELEYGVEIYSAGSIEGYNQYVSKLKILKVNGVVTALKASLDIPFVTLETVPTSGSAEGQEELARSYEQAIFLQNMGATSVGRGPPLVASPAMLPPLLTAIRLGYTFYKVRECCTEQNFSECILKKVAQNLLKRTILRFLKEKFGGLAVSMAPAYNNTVVFNPSSSVAVPANRSSQRIGIAPLPISPPPPADEAWLKKIPACPCSYDDATGVTYNPEGYWEQCGGASQTFHYGSAYEARWIPKKQYDPGQQCNYDQNKKLIGYGLAAGSADFQSPATCGSALKGLLCPENPVGHGWHDVVKWYMIPCEEYVRLRPSSSELCLEKNPVNDWYFGQMCVFVKGFSCPEIRNVFERFRDAQDVPLVVKHFMEKGQVESTGDISAILAFLEKREDEETLSFSASWQQVFTLRVRDYLKDYQKNGKNPAPCQPPFD